MLLIVTLCVESGRGSVYVLCVKLLVNKTAVLIWCGSSAECMHLVTRVHFRSRDNMAVTPFNRSAILENPMLHAHFVVVCFIERELLPMEVLHWGIFDHFFAPVTLILTRWLSNTNLTRIPWRYTRCENMNFLRQGFWKLSSDRLRKIDKQTDRDRHDRNYIPSRVIKNNIFDYNSMASGSAADFYRAMHTVSTISHYCLSNAIHGIGQI